MEILDDFNTISHDLLSFKKISSTAIWTRITLRKKSHGYGQRDMKLELFSR